MASIHDIFKKFLDNKCTKEEKDILLRYFDLNEDDELTKEMIDEELAKETFEEAIPDRYTAILTNNHDKLRALVRQPVKKKKNRMWKVAASIAASAIIICALLYVYRNGEKNPSATTLQTTSEIEPGSNRAVLVLENGKSYDLSTESSGIKTDKNAISYHNGSPIFKADRVQMATLSTPRKGQYTLILPDGTQVRLNAESSLRYPTSFVGSERVVELKGEGYFKVAHDSKHPFIVKTSQQDLKVLGTEFNLNSYSNENATVTTLITGSVQLVSKSGHEKETLKPNQQATLTQSTYSVKTVDAEAYSAWKDGEFRFKSTLLPEAIRQLERWYDLDVDYTQIPAGIKINASISRDKKLSSVLEVLSDISNVKLKIQGRRLMVIQ